MQTKHAHVAKFIGGTSVSKGVNGNRDTEFCKSNVNVKFHEVDFWSIYVLKHFNVVCDISKIKITIKLIKKPLNVQVANDMY